MRSSRSEILLLLLAGCANPYYLDLPDVELETPADLESRMASYRSGEEKWHGDPRAVADAAIRRHLDVPWKAEPFRPALYEIKVKPEWGTYVVRRYTYPSGATMSYRVKMRPCKDIWIPVQISRYKTIHDLPDDDMHSHNH